MALKHFQPPRCDEVRVIDPKAANEGCNALMVVPLVTGKAGCEASALSKVGAAPLNGGAELGALAPCANPVLDNERASSSHPVSGPVVPMQCSGDAAFLGKRE